MKRKDFNAKKLFILIVLIVMLCSTLQYLDIYSETEEWKPFGFYLVLVLILGFVISKIFTEYDVMTYIYRLDRYLNVYIWKLNRFFGKRIL